jgi:hypothetical protein
MDWSTPTPLPPLPTPAYLSSFDAAGFGQNVAGGIVQGFNFFDAQPVAGLIWFVLLALVIIMGLLSLRNHIENL